MNESFGRISRSAAASVICSALLFAGPGVRAADDPNQPPFPPKVQDNVRWQTLPWQYTSVFFDPAQRPWFYCEYQYRSKIKSKPANDWEHHTKCLVCPELPEDFIEIPAKNVLLGFDRQGRFWEVGEFGLAATNPVKGEFLQRRPLEPTNEADAKAQERQDHPFLYFMYCHSSGRIYFADWQAIHVFDDGEWSVQNFEQTLYWWSDLKYSPDQLGAVEGPDGRFFFWSRRDGMLNAVLVHDGKAWTQISLQDEPKLRGLQEVTPRADGTVHCESTTAGRFEIASLNGNAVSSQSPTAAPEWLPARQPFKGKFAATETDGPLCVHGHIRGIDKSGRVYICGRGEQNARRKRTSVVIFDRRHEERAPTLQVEAIDLASEGGWRPLTVDSRGNIWARLHVPSHPFLSRYADGEWTHFPVPPALPQAAADNKPRELTRVYGALWVMRPIGAPPDWKLDAPQCYFGVPPMANTALIQPLDGDGLIAVEQSTNHTYFFDGQEWTSYESMTELIAQRYGDLKKRINNTTPAYDVDRYRLGRDALGRIWTYVPKTHHVHIYDGESWEETELTQVVFDEVGERCSTEKFLYDTTAKPFKPALALPAPHDQINAPFLASFGDRRVWRVGSRLPSGAMVPTDVLKSDAFKNGAILRDSASRYWFYNYDYLNVVRTDGGTVRFQYKSAHLHPAIVEQSPATFWMFATDGLDVLAHDPPGSAPHRNSGEVSARRPPRNNQVDGARRGGRPVVDDVFA